MNSLVFVTVSAVLIRQVEFPLRVPTAFDRTKDVTGHIDKHLCADSDAVTRPQI